MRSIWLAGVSLGVLCGSPAFAQSAPPAQEAANTIDDIIVTAQRRQEQIQDVPVAITALTAERLEATGVTELRDLTQAVPGLTFSRRNQVFQPTIRGIGTSGASAGEESSVGIYVDGVYQPEMYSGSFDVLKVDRIEVLRGPQGTLFGRNTSGGLVNVITPDPTYDPSLEVGVRAGSFGERSVQVYAATGLTDNIAVDIASRLYSDTGYIDDLNRGGMTGDRESFSVRTKLLFEPSDTARIRLALSYSDTSDNSAIAVQPLNRNSVLRQTYPAIVLPTEPWQSNTNVLPVLETEQYGLSLQTEWDFSNFTLETTSSGQVNDLFVANDLDGTQIQLSAATSENPSVWAGQEVRVLGDTGRLNWTAGVFGFYGDARLAPVSVFSTSLTTNVTTTNVQFSRTIITSLAAFAEGTYELTDALHLTGGIRYTTEDRSFKATRNGVQIIDTDASFDAWTPHVSAQYFFNDDINAYVSWSRGFKSGVFNTQSTLPSATRPEFVESIEFGIKADPTPWLRANLAVFRYDYTDLQVTARNPVTLLSFQQNAAEAEIQGGELELTFALAPGLDLNLNATYLDATYRSFPNATVTTPRVGGGNTTVIVDASGNHLQRSPQNTYSASLSYERDFTGGTLGMAANYFRSAEYFWDPTERLSQPAYDKLSAQLAWTFPNRVKLAIWGENLTNSVVYSQILTSSNVDYAGFERPRSVGASLSWTY